MPDSDPAVRSVYVPCVRTEPADIVHELLYVAAPVTTPLSPTLPGAGDVKSNRMSPPLTFSVLSVNLPTEPSAVTAPGRRLDPNCMLTLPSLPVVIPSPVPTSVPVFPTLTFPAEA